MRISCMRAATATAIGAAAFALPAEAQSIFDANVRGAPQFLQYQIKSPVNETISEFVIPVFVVVPVSRMLTFDVGTAYARARVQPNGSNTEPKSTISGLT